MKLTILFNPAAGRGKGRRKLGEALAGLRRAGVEPQVLESRSAPHLAELARRAREDSPAMLVSAGGDGTHHHVINGLHGSDIPLGLLPTGTGNDFSEGLGVPADPRAAAQVLLSGRTREVDVGRVGERFYGSYAGVGFDSMVARFVNERARWAQGRLAYVWGILRCLKRLRPQPLELRSDAGDYTGEVALAVVGNNSRFGGGIRIAPLARLDDGRLDVCIVPYMPLLELLRLIPRAYRGEHLAHPRIVYFQARRITLNSSAPLELFADGEFLQALPATIEVVQRSLRVVVPA